MKGQVPHAQTKLKIYQLPIIAAFYGYFEVITFLYMLCLATDPSTPDEHLLRLHFRK